MDFLKGSTNAGNVLFSDILAMCFRSMSISELCFMTTLEVVFEIGCEEHPKENMRIVRINEKAKNFIVFPIKSYEKANNKKNQMADINVWFQYVVFSMVL